jgi:hypothetical protein
MPRLDLTDNQAEADYARFTKTLRLLVSPSMRRPT